MFEKVFVDFVVSLWTRWRAGRIEYTALSLNKCHRLPSAFPTHPDDAKVGVIASSCTEAESLRCKVVGERLVRGRASC